MEKYLFIGVGSVRRFGLAGLIDKVLGDGFPCRTFAVNIIGRFTKGLLMTLFEERRLVQANVRLFLTVGIPGGFTTFSTFSSLKLLTQAKKWRHCSQKSMRSSRREIAV